jgi:hypothetical protein
MLRRSRFSLAHGRGRIAPAPAAAVRSWAWFAFLLRGAMSHSPSSIRAAPGTQNAARGSSKEFHARICAQHSADTEREDLPDDRGILERGDQA